jgi:hypothetical protein
MFKRILGLELAQVGSIGDILYNISDIEPYVLTLKFCFITDCYHLKLCLVSFCVFIKAANLMKVINIFEGKHHRHDRI